MSTFMHTIWKKKKKMDIYDIWSTWLKQKKFLIGFLDKAKYCIADWYKLQAYSYKQIPKEKDLSDGVSLLSIETEKL